MTAIGARPRIAFFTSEYDEIRTGTGTFARYVRRATEAGRFDIVFFSDEMARATAPHERPVRLPVRLPSPPGHFIRQWAWTRAFAAEHRRRPFDVAWFNSSQTAWFATRARLPVPVVIMVNDYSSAMTPDIGATLRVAGPYRFLTRGFWMWFERDAVRHSDIVIVNSEYLRREIIARYRPDPSRVIVLYKGVDLEEFRPAPTHPGPDPAALRVLFMKNDYIRGGLQDVLAALAAAPAAWRVRLTVAGPPTTAHAGLRRLARGLGFRGELRLVGRAPRPEVPALFHDADVLCMPSRVEALGVTLLEGLATGTPVIGSTVGGIPEVLDGGRAGWMAPPYDPAGVLACLREVVERPDERARRVAHGLAHVRRFDVSHALEAFERVAARAAASGARR